MKILVTDSEITSSVEAYITIGEQDVFHELPIINNREPPIPSPVSPQIPIPAPRPGVTTPKPEITKDTTMTPEQLKEQK